MSNNAEACTVPQLELGSGILTNAAMYLIIDFNSKDWRIVANYGLAVARISIIGEGNCREGVSMSFCLNKQYLLQLVVHTQYSACSGKVAIKAGMYQ